MNRRFSFLVLALSLAACGPVEPRFGSVSAIGGGGAFDVRPLGGIGIREERSGRLTLATARSGMRTRSRLRR